MHLYRRKDLTPRDIEELKKIKKERNIFIKQAIKKVIICMIVCTVLFISLNVPGMFFSKYTYNIYNNATGLKLIGSIFLFMVTPMLFPFFYAVGLISEIAETYKWTTMEYLHVKKQRDMAEKIWADEEKFRAEERAKYQKIGYYEAIPESELLMAKSLFMISSTDDTYTLDYLKKTRNRLVKSFASDNTHDTSTDEQMKKINTSFDLLKENLKK